MSEIKGDDKSYPIRQCYLQFQMLFLINFINHWLNFQWDLFIFVTYLALRAACSIQQLRSILISCSEVSEVTYSQDDIVCLCWWKLYWHFSWPISEGEKIILLFHINKGSRIWFCAVFQLVIIYMCAKNKTLASQNSWLYVIQICQISCAELEIPALLLFWFLSHVSLPLHLYICHTVPRSLSYSMNPAQEVWSGTCWPAAYTIWSQEINKIQTVPYWC